MGGTSRCTQECRTEATCPEGGETQCIGSRSTDTYYCVQGCRRETDCDFGTCDPTSDFSTYYCD